jgi:3-deoxy-manno-octulosonate cytidylyltransferase (CMP-KDO synthetase)
VRVAAVIPARMNSARLPGKPLLPIAGIRMIVRVLERARACPSLQRIIVATDSHEIRRVVEESGVEAWMTSPDHHSGSDRVAEVAAKLSEELILNIQGDWPLLPASIVETLIDFGRRCSDLTVATAMVPIRTVQDALNPNVVKVEVDRYGRALCFSRWPIPYSRSDPLDPVRDSSSERECRGYFKHVGIYLFRREFLLRYVAMCQTPLEIAESLEQLRILEHGYPVYVVQVAEDALSVDTPEDLAFVESILAG